MCINKLIQFKCWYFKGYCEMISNGLNELVTKIESYDKVEIIVN